MESTEIALKHELDCVHDEGMGETLMKYFAENAEI